MKNTEFKHVINKKSPELRRIRTSIEKFGYYWVNQSQKRKVTGWEIKGDDVILTGVIVSPL